LDESSHVRQVTEHLHGAVRTSKSTAIIDTILNDIHQGSDHSWRSCLSSNANRSSCIYGTAGDDISVRTSSPTPSTCTWPASVDGYTSNSGSSSLRAHTISIGEQTRRAAVSSRTYTPPSPSQPFTFALKKPPLPKRTITATNSVVSTIPDFTGSSDEQTFKRNGSLLSCSSTDISSETTVRRPSRPLSFACEDVVTARPNGTPPTVRNGPVNNGTCTANDGNAQAKKNISLIAETIEQIDKLGSELDSYCNTAPVSVTHQTIRFRSGSCKPPPPPERRNSTITAATPTAPSVAEIRAAGGTTAASSEYASSIASSSEFSRDQFTMRYV
uniref:IMD domain-containing protein n=1 Tax=Gongylonema pulchrum TaxID=637853 RepID=A0A183EE14_9BILA